MNIERKLSFNEDNSKLRADFCRALSKAEFQELSEILDFYLSAESDVEYAFALSFCCLCVRIFDMGRYSFLFPYALSEESEPDKAVSEITDYCAIEELSPIFSDVSPCDLQVFLDLGYRHIDIDSETPEGDSYRVRIKNECDLIGEYPSVSEGEVSLTELFFDDAADYYRLSCDKENNKYWGYDFREDHKGITPEGLIEIARSEFRSSAALPLAIRQNGIFVGEAVFHAFDFKGGADIGIRMLPEMQGKGIGKAVLGLLAELAKAIGLTRLFARVVRSNTPSVSLFSAFFDVESETEDAVLFSLLLYR